MADDTASTENSKTREFSKIQMEEVEGILFPNLLHNHRSLKDHIHCIRDMPMRDDDVILWAYPKSGTHWLWEVGSMLLAGKAEYEKRTKENVMMEACSVEDLDRLPSPRLFNTHLAASMLPNGVKDGKVKVIYVYRNPKDVLVSRFFHNKQAPSCKDWTLDMMTPMFLSGKFIYGDYFQQLRNADAYMKANPQVPVFKVSFEDMKEDPVGTVERLARFLGVACSAELCRSVADACSFQRLKEADRTKGLLPTCSPTASRCTAKTSFIFLGLSLPFTFALLLESVSFNFQDDVLVTIAVFLPLLDILGPSVDFFAFYAANSKFRQGFIALVCRRPLPAKK